MDQSARLLCPCDSPGKNTGMGCHAFLQGIFPTQGSNPSLLHLLHCREILYCLSHQGSTPPPPLGLTLTEEDAERTGRFALSFSLPWWLRWSRIYLQCRRPGFSPWVGKIPWRRERLPTPVFWPGESHRQRSLAGYGPGGCKESDTTEQLFLSMCKTSAWHFGTGGKEESRITKLN